jgi:hypothetical protein
MALRAVLIALGFKNVGNWLDIVMLRDRWEFYKYFGAALLILELLFYKWLAYPSALG